MNERLLYFSLNGRDVVPAQAVVQRELGVEAPRVTGVHRIGVLAGICGMHVAVISRRSTDRAQVEAGHRVARTGSG